MMYGKDFITAYAAKNDITKKQAKEEIERFVDTFKSVTYEEGGVSLLGFIESNVVEQPAKEYINPRTGEKGVSEAKNIVKIKIKPSFKNIESED